MKSYSPFLVPLWGAIFRFLEKLSIFTLVRWVIPSLKKNHWFVDAWVLGNLLLSTLSVILLSYFDIHRVIVYCIVSYGLLRVWEIFVYQINVLLFHPFQAKSVYTIYSYRRMIVALIHNFFEIILWFAVSYLALNLNFGQEFTSLNPFSVIYFSMLTMVSYTSTVKSESWSLIAMIILHFQAIIGVFMTLISLARFISLFPKPMEIDEHNQDLVLIDKIESLEEKMNQLIKATQNQKRR